ncbi:MAG: phosphoglycerate kinase [Bacteroidales bacterium]|nr:phosphoglycerate kinase [Bacteroidales bacterium]MDD3666223.1 phosphoglycerate kinase [Bacteroidales bacterium]
MKTINDLSFSGKRALIRVDFNVPLNEKFEITDPTRINAALPTIKKILNDGGSVILMSHLGRPKGGPEHKYSLVHLVPFLSQALGLHVKFADDCIGETAVRMSSELHSGEVLLLENLRFYKEEEKGNEEFAEKLSKLGDVYVNDAFGTAHRAHASTAVIAKFFPTAKMFGYVMGNELASIDRVVKGGEKPFTAILGGAKISGKIEIIENLLPKVDHLIVGGGMMFTFIKALGGKTGNSLVEDDLLQLATDTLDKAKKLGVTIHLATDTVVADKFDNEANHKICPADEIPDGWMGLDIGPATVEAFSKVINQSKTILWNGPMGVFEMSSFEEGTRQIALAIAKATSQGTFSLVGGGDSVAAVNKYDLAEKVSYVSTGGGAMLEYIEGKELPGVKFVME